MVGLSARFAVVTEKPLEFERSVINSQPKVASQSAYLSSKGEEAAAPPSSALGGIAGCRTRSG